MIHIDSNRFAAVFGKIFAAYAAKRGIFARYTAASAGPQHNHKPTGITIGSPDHLYWLTLVALSDRRTNSAVLYNNFAAMFSRHRSLFCRNRYPTRAKMERLFRKFKIALPNTEIKFFIERKMHLDTCFDGDPLKIYEGVTSVEELMNKFKRIKKERGIHNLFPGAKEKIFSLLAMFLREYVDLDFSDVVPIDVWVQAIATSTGVISEPGVYRSSPLERILRPPMSRLFHSYLGVSGATDATWILGKHGCTHCMRRNMATLCPVYAECQGPFERMRHPTSHAHYGAIQVPPKFISRCAI